MTEDEALSVFAAMLVEWLDRVFLALGELLRCDT